MRLPKDLGAEVSDGHRRLASLLEPCDSFFAFPPAVRKVIYTTNAIENINAQLRKIIETRGHFSNDEAATKLIWLALRNITAKWSRTGHDWKTAMNQFAISIIRNDSSNLQPDVQLALNTELLTLPRQKPPPAEATHLPLLARALSLL